MTTRKITFLRDIERTATGIMDMGNDYVEEAISFLGRIIDRSTNLEQVFACEKLIEVLNEGPEIRTINRLTEEQSQFAAKLLTAIRDCVTLTV